MKTRHWVLAAALLASASHGFAQTPTDPAEPVASNVPPPSGALIDLAGQPLPGVNLSVDPMLDPGNYLIWHHYSVDFNPQGALTAITFAMRADPGYLYLDDVSVTEAGSTAGNLIINGDFEGGVVDGTTVAGTTPTGWNYANPFLASFNGSVATGADHTPGMSGIGSAYLDGSVQAYDDINQIISTDIRSTYTLSFWVATNQSGTFDRYNTLIDPDVFRDLSSNGNVTDVGGNAFDLLAYATYPAPTLNTVPEPTSLAIIGISLLGLGVARRRHKPANHRP